jgi:hypothetical protein
MLLTESNLGEGNGWWRRKPGEAVVRRARRSDWFIGGLTPRRQFYERERSTQSASTVADQGAAGAGLGWGAALRHQP